MTNLKNRRLFSIFSLACLILPASLVVPEKAMCVPAAKKRSYVRPGAKSNVPIDTVGQSNQSTFDPNGLLVHMEDRLRVIFQKQITGPTRYCELHYVLHGDGRITNVMLWRSSGDKAYDQNCQAVLNAASPFAPNDDVERIDCVVYFRTEVNGGSVQVAMPQYQSSSSKVDRQIAQRRTYDNNVVKIMQDRITAAQKVLGPDSPKLSESINFLANTQRDMGDFAAAEKSYQRAIDIRRKSNGPASPELAESLSDQGDSFRLKGDLASAEDCYKQVINNIELKRCTGLYKALKGYARLCAGAKRVKDANFLNNRIMQLQQNQPLDALPENMLLNAAASPEASPPEAKPEDKQENKTEPVKDKNETTK